MEVEDALRKGYAEKVPQEELRRNDGQVWYIPPSLLKKLKRAAVWLLKLKDHLMLNSWPLGKVMKTLPGTKDQIQHSAKAHQEQA